MTDTSTGVGVRRRWTAERKLAILRDSLEPGISMSMVARKHGVHPSQLFHWRKLHQDGGLSAMEDDKEAAPASDLDDAPKKIRELQLLLGKKTVENEILRQALEYVPDKECMVPPASPPDNVR